MIDNNSIIIKGIIGEDYKYSNFVDDIRLYNISKRKNIRIGIDSLGGYVDENDKIYNKILELKKNHTITTYNLGDCMSCASILFVAGDVRIFDFAKGKFLIHSPWVEAEGDASQLRKVASDLQRVEDRFALLYAKVGKSDLREIKDVMDEDRNLTPAEVKKFKFATEIKNAEVAPLPAPSSRNDAATGMTPQEHNGIGTPKSTALRTGMKPLPLRCFFICSGVSRKAMQPARKYPKSSHGAIAAKTCQKLAMYCHI